MPATLTAEYDVTVAVITGDMYRCEHCSDAEVRNVRSFAPIEIPGEP